MSPFSLNGKTVSLAVTSTTGEVAILPASGSLRIYNAGPALAFIRTGVGTQTAVATDTPIPPGEDLVFSVSSRHTNFAGICASGQTATLYIQVGDGI